MTTGHLGQEAGKRRRPNAKKNKKKKQAKG